VLSRQLLRKKIGKWSYFVNVLRKQSSNVGGAKTTVKTFRKEVGGGGDKNGCCE